jgi:hypothetical protein
MLGRISDVTLSNRWTDDKARRCFVLRSYEHRTSMAYTNRHRIRPWNVSINTPGTPFPQTGRRPSNSLQMLAGRCVIGSRLPPIAGVIA